MTKLLAKIKALSTETIAMAFLGLFIPIIIITVFVTSEKPSTKKAKQSLPIRQKGQLSSSRSKDREENFKQQIIEKPEVVAAKEFKEREKSPFNPDLVIMTKKVIDLPKDILNHSLLGKFLSKETVFYYQDDPQFLRVLGTLRRLAFEHELQFKDSILEQFLSLPAEIAFWKGYDGKLEDFLFVATDNNLNQKIIQLYLSLKKIKDDKSIKTFSYNGVVGFYWKVGGKKLAIWHNKHKLYITNLSPAFFPDKNQKALKEFLLKEKIQDNGGSFYSRLFNTTLGEKKHRFILSTKFLSFGHNYFFPSFKAFSFDYGSKTWAIQAFLKSDTTSPPSNIPLWKVTPSNPALCIAIPIHREKFIQLNQKYIDLTKKRFASFNQVEAAKAKENYFLKNILTPNDINNHFLFPINICWYKSSSLLTPLFIVKTKNALAIKEKVKFTFSKFIGALEKNYKESPIRITTEQGFTHFERAISSKYGIANRGEKFEYLHYKNYFPVKVSLNDDFIIFSPDRELTNRTVQTILGKNPSIYDQIRTHEKNISLILRPSSFAKLLEKYSHKALPNEEEPVFRRAISHHMSKIITGLSKVKAVKLSTPKGLSNKHSKWENIAIY